MRVMKRNPSERGATLVEVIVVVAILGFFAVVLSGLLRAVMVVGRNLPTSGQVQTYQQVVDQINTFLIAFSRDVREAKKLEVKSTGCPDPTCSECLLIHRDEGAFITYGYWENEKAVKREGKVEIEEVYRGNSPIFQVVNDSSVTVTLPVRYLSQTKRGNDALETRVFSFTVERRLSPGTSP
ncbi:MAG: type II secretion system protein [Candidatus Caldatribacteriaceae bacterium]